MPLCPIPFLNSGGGPYPQTIMVDRLRGIALPSSTKHSISQYAENSSFMVRGEKCYVDELARLLEVFNEALEMEIN